MWHVTGFALCYNLHRCDMSHSICQFRSTFTIFNVTLNATVPTFIPTKIHSLSLLRVSSASYVTCYSISSQIFTAIFPPLFCNSGFITFASPAIYPFGLHYLWRVLLFPKGPTTLPVCLAFGTQIQVLRLCSLIEKKRNSFSTRSPSLSLFSLDHLVFSSLSVLQAGSMPNYCESFA